MDLESSLTPTKFESDSFRDAVQNDKVLSTETVQSIIIETPKVTESDQLDFQLTAEKSQETKVLEGTEVEKKPEAETKTEATEEFKKPLLKSKSSSKNLLGRRKSQNFQEDKKPELLSISGTHENTSTVAEQKQDSVSVEKPSESTTTKESEVKTEETQSGENLKKKLGGQRGRLPLQRAQTVRLEHIERDDNNLSSPSLKKLSEEAEKKLREELEISNKHIEILDIIINFADKPRDIGGNFLL